MVQRVYKNPDEAHRRFDDSKFVGTIESLYSRGPIICTMNSIICTYICVKPNGALFTRARNKSSSRVRLSSFYYLTRVVYVPHVCTRCGVCVCTLYILYDVRVCSAPIYNICLRLYV